jgi:DNA mismatch endonuclease (patch repair protein)
MSRIKAKNTKPEMLVRSILHKHGFRFRLHVETLPGKPDIILPKYKIAIFVHGCFWHMHGCKNSKIPATRHDWWKEKLESNVCRDAKQYEMLKYLGWKVLVVWECEFRRVTHEKFQISEDNLITNLNSIILVSTGS